jgi:2-polyprenyl-3-methyl-5-hydroxy-6-metoxy-1,4-benzoquinol methylase
MPTYDAAVDAAAENNSHALMLRLVGPDRRVLDVGCATGYLGKALMDQGCRVSGVEYDPEAAARATEVLDEVLVADLETADLVEHFGAGSFDVLAFGDVLEHLRDPSAVLRAAVPLLADKGSVVISIPNVTHAALRLALLQGRWTYSDRGLLDRTHVQFFTRGTLLGMLRESGLVAVDVRGTTAPTFGTEVAVDQAALPDGVVEWVERQPDADVYQFVVRAVRDDADGAVAALRAHADEAQRRAEEAQEALARAAAELASRDARIDELIQALATTASSAEELDRRAVEAETTVHALEHTRTMRALRTPRRLYGALRRGAGL